MENIADYRKSCFNCSGCSRRSACALITGHVANILTTKHDAKPKTVID